MKNWHAVLIASALLLVSAAIGQTLPDHSRAVLKRIAPTNQWLEAHLPREIGPWAGQSVTIDTDVFVAAGATHFLAREYTNRESGQRVEMVLLYGDPFQVYQHTPDSCYPAAGYNRARAAAERPVEIGPVTAKFYAGQFVRHRATELNSVDVWYAWHGNNGTWTNTLGRIQRGRMAGLWRLMVTSPSSGREAEPLRSSACEMFLRDALPVLEPLIAAVPSLGA